jgi:hypothetical protein
MTEEAGSGSSEEAEAMRRALEEAQVRTVVVTSSVPPHSLHTAY